MACISRFVVAVSNLRNATKSDTAAVSQQRARRTGDVERVRRPRCAKCTQSHLARTRTNAQGTTKKKKKIFLAPQVTDQAREPRGDAEKGDFEPWPTDFTYASRATQVRDGVVQAGVLKKNERSKAYPLFFFSIQSARLKPKLRATICVNSFGGFA